MKTQFARQLKLNDYLRAIICIAVLFASTQRSTAQLSTEQSFAYGDQKIRVNLSVRPSTKEFKAGIASVDSTVTKIKVWVCNGEERKCTVTISNTSGIFWTTSFKDAYYNQVYDLSSLDDGEYKIEIGDGRKIFCKTVVIRSAVNVTRDLDIY
jgi:hypothetical protein